MTTEITMSGWLPALTATTVKPGFFVQWIAGKKFSWCEKQLTFAAGTATVADDSTCTENELMVSEQPVYESGAYIAPSMLAAAAVVASLF